jgi:hypothetical protein
MCCQGKEAKTKERFNTHIRHIMCNASLFEYQRRCGSSRTRAISTAMRWNARASRVTSRSEHHYNRISYITWSLRAHGVILPSCFIQASWRASCIFCQLSMQKPLNLKPRARRRPRRPTNLLGSAHRTSLRSRVLAQRLVLARQGLLCKETPRLVTYSAKSDHRRHCSIALSACDCRDMSHRPLFLAPRLVQQQFARSRYTVRSVEGNRLQWRRVFSSAVPADAIGVLRSKKWYSAEEDSTILNMKRRDFDWATIAFALPGRTPRV